MGCQEQKKSVYRNDQVCHNNRLWWAAKNGDKKLATRLISQGASVNAKTDKGYSPLLYAAGMGHTDVAQLLIDKGAFVNIKDSEGDTPLHYAGSNGHKDVANILIKNGADVNARANGGLTPLCYAIGYSRMDVAELLRNNGGNMGSLFLDAVVTGDIEKVKSLLSTNHRLINASEHSWKWTPLFWAIHLDNKDISELLIKEGADINVKDTNGRTLLAWAIKKGNKELADLLKKHGAVEKTSTVTKSSDPYKANTFWKGTCDQPGYSPYPMTLFIKSRTGKKFEGVTWYPTWKNGICKISGTIVPNGITFVEDSVLQGNVIDSCIYRLTLKGEILKGSYVDPRAGATVTFTGNVSLKKAKEDTSLMDLLKKHGAVE